MRKVGVLLILILFLTYVIAQETEQDDINQGISCLEEKITDCSSLTIPEIAFTLLSPVSSSTKTECKSALNSKKSSQNCWPSSGCTIKDTALAIYALDQNGENTDSAESWLLLQNTTPTDLIWYLQQNSEQATQCDIQYLGNKYPINIAENKKIDSPAGNCLTLAQSEFWLQVSPNCYDTEFKVACKQDFIATLFYKNVNSPKFFILSETPSAPQYGEITLKVNSKCFGSDSCDYEGSLWATFALQKTGHNVDAFVPYLIAMSDTNTQFLPNAFIYMITGREEYSTKLIKQQTPQNYWIAGTLYNRFYDTAIALLALGISSEQTSNARKELLFSQSADGCWGTIRDTAIVLWALKGISFPIPSTEDCKTAGYYCIPKADCLKDEQLENFFCFEEGLGSVCCKSENLKPCSELNGRECSSDEQCSGSPKKAFDTSSCCLAECIPKKSECEQRGYVCSSACSKNQERVSYECDSGICCKLKPATEKGTSIIWFLIIGIVIIGGIILYLQRNKLKILYFKFKNRFKKEPSGASPPQPPRPGFPPVRRMPPRPLPPRPQPRESSSDVFRKLREMTK